jgi:mannose-6-phosphate isomerase-like protein (cupin superfamily)
MLLKVMVTCGLIAAASAIGRQADVPSQNPNRLPIGASAEENPLLITQDEMIKLEAAPGEILHIVDGKAHGFESLALAISDTASGKGAPPHRHKCEEAHVVMRGTVAYEIGDRKFTAKAPFVVRIPAGVTHSFKNVGTEPIHVIGVFPRNSESEIDAD